MAQIEKARANLHIAYGHTSHGSQITSGMTGLVGFANGSGKGLNLPNNAFSWSDGGSNGAALDLHDKAMGGDVGYYPNWVNNTRSYLNTPANSDVNVIIWSWCGQVTGKYTGGTLQSQYLDPMNTLEAEFPGVTFVYMTGHVDGGGGSAFNYTRDNNNKAANQMIRDYVIANNKVLYDFADIERYNPDGDYFEFVKDNCDYYDESGIRQGNWAEEWQNDHKEGDDWYSVSAAHSKSLNGNQKAYAAWHLWTGIEERMSAVPLPGSLILFAPAIIGLVAFRRRSLK